MADRKELILKRLDDEGRKTAAFFRGLDAAQFAQQVYTTGPEWHARELLAHVTFTELEIRRLIENVLAGGPGAPDGFDIDVFNAAEADKLRGAAVPELIERFESNRAATRAVVQAMSDADFDRLGRHPWLGRAPLEQILKLLYRHTMLHERDIRKAVETGQPVPHVEASPRA